jgi:hypothetical protein
MQPNAYSALTDLGFHAAEMRMLSGRLAEACAREDTETVRDVAAALRPYCAEYSRLFVRYLAEMHGETANPDAPRLVHSQSTSL